MSDKPLFIQYCAKDFLTGTTNLSVWEELAYRRVIDMIYETNDRLDDNDKKLGWSTKCGSRWPKIKAVLIEKGKIEIVDGRITNARCRKELEKVEKKIHQKAEAGKASAEARKSLKNNNTMSTAVATDVPVPLQRTMELSELDSKEEKKEPPLPPEGGDEPELFFQHPPQSPEAGLEQRKPRKARKAQAVRFTDQQLKPYLEQFQSAYPVSDVAECFDTANRTFARLVNGHGVDPQALVAAAGRYYQAQAGRGKVGTSFIKRPNNWLTSGDWKAWDGVSKFPDQNRPSSDRAYSEVEETIEQWRARTAAVRAWI